MSTRTRIVNAKVLFENERREGALLSVLIAVAATARKRYPKSTMSDKKAFTAFLGDEMKTITGMVRNFSVKFRGQVMPLQDFLYKYIRCSLAHEATLPKDVKFERVQGLKVSVTDDCITFSDGLIDGLARAVSNAPENKAEFGG